ncbi:hypothetical protein GTW43_32160 [Streptomyces sp. SID5785]|uniref:hypothetical protein n=1 Tax=Streptomyces sp. SID5785 TaxID=2690309 RepID=UPI00136110E8|nr:hypothetical protein [Streptomyces sp. SID5785]MZD09701.1 hypothetical protein [Streptomyces sp. SID5785]
MGIRFTEDDFGITHLASMFHQDWRLSGSARDVVISYVAQTSDPFVLALAEDALRLASSGDADTVATLWECATGSFHRLNGAVSGLDWFREVADICERALTQAGVHANLEVGESAYGAFTGRVVAEIDELETALDEAITNNPVASIPNALPALRVCASDICPELAFRVLLGFLMEYSCEIDHDLYARFAELGREFPYGEFVVSRISFLMR